MAFYLVKCHALRLLALRRSVPLTSPFWPHHCFASGMHRSPLSIRLLVLGLPLDVWSPINVTLYSVCAWVCTCERVWPMM
jgi:hypothetical protein